MKWSYKIDGILQEAKTLHWKASAVFPCMLKALLLWLIVIVKKRCGRLWHSTGWVSKMGAAQECDQKTNHEVEKCTDEIYAGRPSPGSAEVESAISSADLYMRPDITNELNSAGKAS